MTWGFKGFLARFLEAPDAGAYDRRSPTGRGRIRYNNAGPVGPSFQASVDGGPYLDLMTTTTTNQPMIVAATIADLEAVPVNGLSNGSIASVLTVRDIWTLEPASAVPLDGITRVQAADGVRVWQRAGYPNLHWTIQDTWYIDPVAGDDEARGSTLGSAIQTNEELRRRLGQLPITQITFVNLVGPTFSERLIVDFNTDPALFGAMIYVGERTEVSQAAIVTATPHVNAPQLSRAFGTVDFAGDQAANVNRLMVALDGAAQGATAWGLGQPLAGPITSLRTGPWIDTGGSEVFPANGDTVGFYDLTEVGEVYSAEWTVWGIYNVIGTGTLNIAGGIENSATSIGVSRWDDKVFCSGRIVVEGSPAGDGTLGSQFAGCLFTHELHSLQGSNTLLYSSCFAGSNSALLVYGNCNSTLTLSFGFGAELTCFGAANITNAAFTDQGAADDCAEVSYGGTLRFTANVWGRNITAAGAGRVLRCQQNAVMTYLVTSPPDFTPNTATQVANTTASLGTLPTINANNLCAIIAGV